MFSILLRTTLIAAQILTGFWGSSTLCLRSDGTICCVHELACACSCCEHDHAAASDSDEPHSHSIAVCAIAGTHELGELADDHGHDDDHDDNAPTDSVPHALPLTPGTPCGCRHVPLSTGTAPASEKSSRLTSSDKRNGRPSIPQAGSCRGMQHRRCLAGITRHYAPVCRSVGLTMLPSTVIRC